MAGDDRSTDSLLFRSLTLPPPHQDNTHSLLLINFQCLKPGAQWKSFSRLCVIITVDFFVIVKYEMCMVINCLHGVWRWKVNILWILEVSKSKSWVNSATVEKY